MYTEARIKLIQLIDLDVIKQNLLSMKRQTNARLLFMVKADAYGHGIVPVSLAVEPCCDLFGVATVEEGVLLRKSGIKKPILTALCLTEEIETSLKANLTISVSSCEQLREVIKNSNRLAVTANVHLKLDTGMHRLGFEDDELDCALKICKQNKTEIAGCYSHFRLPNNQQVIKFLAMSNKVVSVYPRACRHIVSTTSLYREDLHFDLVRVGIGGYKNAMTVLSQVVGLRYVRKGDYLGYGDTILEKDTNVALVFGGYADGVQRECPSSAFIKGKNCNVLGKICMDMFAVDVDNLQICIGDEVILLGDGKSLDDVAQERNTIDYTVLTSWQGRVERIYFDNQTKCTTHSKT